MTTERVQAPRADEERRQKDNTGQARCAREQASQVMIDFAKIFLDSNDLCMSCIWRSTFFRRQHMQELMSFLSPTGHTLLCPTGGVFAM